MIIYAGLLFRSSWRLVALFVLIAISATSSAQQRVCRYGLEIFADNSYRVSGATCQACYSGRWHTHDTRAPSLDLHCLASDSPAGARSGIAAPADACAGEDGGVFSDGAIRFDGSKCWRCARSAWIETDAVQACNVARSIDEQRVVPSPVLPKDLEDHLSTIMPGLKVVYTLKREEFTALEAMVGATLQNRERVRDGKWSLEHLFAGYGDVLRYADDWEIELSLIRKWRSSSPKNVPAALMEAQYWIAYSLRVGGDNRLPRPEGAERIFRERAAMARSVLQASKAYAASNPMWYRQMIIVATLQKRSERERIALFKEAVAAAPWFYPIYVAMATSYSPRWGGSLEQYRQFVQIAVERSKPFEGDALYARLYWHLRDIEREKDPFRDLAIPWPQMKIGFESLLERYPESEWNLHNFAAFACRAGDARTFASLLPKLSESAASRMRDAWRDAYSFNYCRTLFTKTI